MFCTNKSDPLRLHLTTYRTSGIRCLHLVDGYKRTPCEVHALSSQSCFENIEQVVLIIRLIGICYMANGMTITPICSSSPNQ